MTDLQKLQDLINRGNGSVAFFHRNRKFYCVVKYLGGIKNPSREYTGEGSTLEEAIRNTHTPPPNGEKKPVVPLPAMPGVTVTHRPPKVTIPVMPGVTTR